jgi:dihydroorotate dehydrogenase (NAD+) catalytic subunit
MQEVEVMYLRELSTEFLGIKAKSPLVLPAGIMGMTWSGMRYVIDNGCGMITSKSMTLELRAGHSGPAIAEFDGGLLNCMGLCNPGIEEGLSEINEFKNHYSDTPVIASVFATNPQDFCELIHFVNDSSSDFIELNLSCPNVMDEFGLPLSASKDQVALIVSQVKAISIKPVIAKLSPNVTNLPEIAFSAQESGADALCLVNTLGPGMLIDIDICQPVLSNKFGGISGACLKPIALKSVYEAYSRVSIPIIGMGGVSSGSDAIEMLMAGASIVGIGTAIYKEGIEVFDHINKGIIQYMEKYSYKSVSEIPRLEKQSAS